MTDLGPVYVESDYTHARVLSYPDGCKASYQTSSDMGDWTWVVDDVESRLDLRCPHGFTAVVFDEDDKAPEYEGG